MRSYTGFSVLKNQSQRTLLVTAIRYVVFIRLLKHRKHPFPQLSEEVSLAAHPV